MQTLQWLIIGLAGLISAGCAVRITLLALTIAVNPEQKSSCFTQIKNVVIVLVITLAVGSAPIIQNIITAYFT